MATPTPMVPVTSSQLSYIGYDKDSNTLYITFKNGSVYEYTDVPITVYNELMGAASVGKYFASNIKNNYRNSRIK